MVIAVFILACILYRCVQGAFTLKRNMVDTQIEKEKSFQLLSMVKICNVVNWISSTIAGKRNLKKN